MPGSVEVESLAKTLSTYGPWAVCAILFVILIAMFWFMWRMLDKKEAEWKTLYQQQGKDLGDLLEKRNEQFIQILTSCGVVLEQTKAVINECRSEIKEATAVSKKTCEALAKFELLTHNCQQKNQ